MRRFRNIFRHVALQVRRATLRVIDIVDDDVQAMLRQLRIMVFVLGVVMMLGVGVAAVGFHVFRYDLMWMITAGKFIIALCGLHTSYLTLKVMVRLGITAYILAFVSNFISAFARRVRREDTTSGNVIDHTVRWTDTSADGDENTTVTTHTVLDGQIFSNRDANLAIRNILAVLAWLDTFAVLALLLPVYINLIAFMGAMVSGMLIGFATYAYAYQHYWAKRFVWGTGLVATAVFVLAIIFAAQMEWTSHRYIMQQRTMLMQNEATREMDQEELAIETVLVDEWVALEFKRQHGTLTDADLKDFAGLQEKLRNLKSAPLDLYAGVDPGNASPTRPSLGGIVPSGTTVIHVPTTAPKPPDFSPDMLVIVGLLALTVFIIAGTIGGKKG